jgi:hypothetical protein
VYSCGLKNKNVVHEIINELNNSTSKDHKMKKFVLKIRNEFVKENN